MPDLPDYYTQTSIAEAEAVSLDGGLDVNKPDDPVSRDIYLATDTHILYVCFADGTWTGFDASILTQGILTLYANMLGGGKQIKNIANPTAAQDAATRAYVLARAALYLPLAGGTMAGNIVMGGNKLTGLGAGAVAGDSLRYEQLVLPTKEFFVPVTYGTEMTYFGYGPVAKCDAAAEYGNIAFYIPADFSNITSAVIIVIPQCTEVAANWDLSTFYGANGASYGEHAEADAASTYNVTANILFEVDISDVLSNLAAGDYVEVRLLQGEATHNVNIIGVRFKYS